MVALPGGTFQMGSTDGDDDEQPVHEVTLRAFALDRTEVTVAAYGACVAAGRCKEPETGEYYNWRVSGREGHPVNGVDWQDATAYCAWADKRLPTEAEWEYAARSGGRAQRYPWGDEAATCERAVMADGGIGCGKGGTWPVCSKARGNSAQGVCDLAGNVWEWVQDDYAGYSGLSVVDPTVKNGKEEKVVRGGSWINNDARYLRAAFRLRYTATRRFFNVGFRCARTL